MFSAEHTKWKNSITLVVCIKEGLGNSGITALSVGICIPVGMAVLILVQDFFFNMAGAG